MSLVAVCVTLATAVWLWPPPPIPFITVLAKVATTNTSRNPLLIWCIKNACSYNVANMEWAMYIWIHTSAIYIHRYRESVGLLTWHDPTYIYTYMIIYMDADVNCPLHSNGDHVADGCECNPGYSGTIEAITAAPFHTGSCTGFYISMLFSASSYIPSHLWHLYITSL